MDPNLTWKSHTINKIKKYRNKERLAFNETIEAHGVNDRALLQLDDLTHTYQDEHDVKQAQDSKSVRNIIRDYPDELD